MNTSRSSIPRSHRLSAQSGQTKDIPDQGPVGVLLDLAPPFAFLESDEFASFSQLVRKHGAWKIALTPVDRAAFFFPANDKVRDYYIAPKEALDSADGAFDAYMSSGFLEERLPAHLQHPDMLDAVQKACGLSRMTFAGISALVIPQAEPMRAHLDNILATHRSRFMQSGEPVERLLKGVATASRLFVPTGDITKSHMTEPASPLLRLLALSTEEARTLRLRDDETAPPAALVIGLERRQGMEPIAFLPIQIVGQKDRTRIALPERPFGILLSGRRLAENAERADIETHVIDLDLPAITPWALAWPLILGHIAEAINATLRHPETPLADIVLLDENRQKALTCWIEVQRQAPVPSTSLNRLDRLSLMPNPLRIAPGLTPLATHAAGDRAPAAKDIGMQARLTHSDPSFPLDPYQARTAAAVATLQGNWAQAVTGPPGTGKTSMMRDVISDTVAHHLRRSTPAALLLAGPTIQAYENLLSAVSFSWECAPDDCPRLFPDFPHIGAIIPISSALASAGPSRPVPHLKFFSARARVDFHKDYMQVDLPAEAGKIIADSQTASVLSLLLSSGGQLPIAKVEADAEEAAIRAKLNDISGLISHLHMAADAESVFKLNAVPWPQALTPWKAEFREKFDTPVSATLTERLDAALDVTLRFYAFHLVFRLSQVSFVAAAYGLRARQDELRKLRMVKQKDRQEMLQAFKDAIALLLPIRTATVTSIGGKAEEQFGRPADIVIIDEAGMMEPHFVPCVMAEGQSTLAVGDPYQIPPVGSDALPIHGALLMRASLPEDQVRLWSMPEIATGGQGLAEKAGNGLSIIEAMSPFRGSHALVLRRHYRCPASIIEISNDLVYRPRGIALEAVKKDPAPNPERLPVIATILHDGAPDPKANFNPQEAEAIVTGFLMYHRAILGTAKGAPATEDITLDRHLELMASAVAFISPYRQQAKLDELRGANKARYAALYGPHLPAGAKVIFEGFLPNLMLARLVEQLPGQEARILDVIRKTVFGTIHALQGAERPVVFLSCVADEKTEFFNSDMALINVAVTRAQNHLVIARSAVFASRDAAGTPARSIAETIQRSRVILPERLMIVESETKARKVAQSLPHVLKVVATRGSIGQVSGLDADGHPLVDLAASTSITAANLAEAKRWITPVDEGGLGLTTLILGTDADAAGEVIARDVMHYLGLDGDEIMRRGLTVTRWPMEDPAALRDALVDDIAAARSFNPEITGRWRAARHRAQGELRTALSRGIRSKLRAQNPKADYPSLQILRTMRWLAEQEASGWTLRGRLLDASGQSFEATLMGAPGQVITFPSEAEAQTRADELLAAPDLIVRDQAVPSPVHTRRSLYDVLTVLSWGGIAPLKAMRVLQRLFEKSVR